MNSNRLYKMFGSKSRLSREDITNYGNTTDESAKHAIEMETSDSFESDAMEGWEDLSYDTSVMKSLDKKFASSSNIGYYFGGAAIVAVGITSIFLFGGPNEEKIGEKPVIAENDAPRTTLMEDQEITLDESDLIIPAPIENMNLAPKEERVEVKTIQDDFQDKAVEDDPVEVEMLPYLSIYPEPEAPAWERPHELAKEIYLHDLKLVDYSKYRSKPTVKSKQIVLSGTPANMEGEHSDDAEPVWKDVDIAYSSYIDKSIGIFSKGSYKRALTRFETVIDTYNDDVNANFYAGLCLYNLGEYDKAIFSFKNCIFGPFSNFDEESQWMIALSYEKQGKRDQAKKYFKKIIEQGGFYKKQAAEKMK